LDLPAELIQLICSSLEADDVIHLGSTCKWLYHVCSDSLIWRTLAVVAENDQTVCRSLKKSYKQYYGWKQERKRRWKRGECDGYHLRGHTGRVFSTRIWGDDKVITSSDDGLIKVWSLKSRDCILTTQPSQQVAEQAALFDVHIDSQFADRVYALTFGGEIRALKMNLEKREHLTSMRTSELKHILREAQVSYKECVYKSDLVEKIIQRGVIPIVEVSRVLSLHQGPVVTMKSHRGVGVSCSFDGAINMWDLIKVYSKEEVTDEDLCIGTIHGHMSAVNSVSWDGSKIASGGNDTLIMVWDLAGGGVHERTLTGHTGWVWGVEQAFPLSPIYFSGGVDKVVKTWDLRIPNACVNTIDIFDGPVSGLSLQWNDYRLVTSCFDNYIRIFDIRNLPKCHKIDPDLDRITRISSNADRIEHKL